jgi:hypothetical protein
VYHGEERYNVLEHSKYFKKVYEKFDSNTDGVLTEDEWAQMSKNPQAADTNGDRRVTLEEYAKWSLMR